MHADIRHVQKNSDFRFMRIPNWRGVLTDLRISKCRASITQLEIASVLVGTFSVSGHGFGRCAWVAIVLQVRMKRATVQIQTVRRPPEDAGQSPEELGRTLTALVSNAHSRGRAPGSIVVVREQFFDIVPIGALRRNKVQPARFIAGLCGSTREGSGQPLAVGVMGSFSRRTTDGFEQKLTMVFIEWPDCSWWQWRSLVDEHGKIISNTSTIECASEGLRRPRSLGGWWSAHRRNKVRVHLEPMAISKDRVPASDLLQ